MFAEDVGLLPEKLFERVCAKAGNDPERLTARLGDLFASMKSGGEFALETIPCFNGGLFAEIHPIQLESSEVATLLAAARMDWSHVEPSIFGTLFERGLDPAARSQLGANYTDPATIQLLIEPVIVRPLLARWEAVKAFIADEMEKYAKGGRGSQSSLKSAQSAFLGFVEDLKSFRVLDAACGSGNFLYLALRGLKDLEHRANLDAEALGLHRQLGIETNPANVLGIELNPYAAELARVTVWIGEIQWMLSRGYQIRRDPILAKLDNIECRDAVLSPDGTEPQWPAADVIVGNPPFIGDKKMRAELGDEYVTALRKRYAGRVPGGADLVTYWFEKSRDQIASGKCNAAGLVATNSIRQATNRKVLDRVRTTVSIFEAWSDLPWVNDGAEVRVSLVCFGKVDRARCDGKDVDEIFSDLKTRAVGGADADVTQARSLRQNHGWTYFGLCLAGNFRVPGELAREWLLLPNPNGRPNSDVIRPLYNGNDVTGRFADRWVIDFGPTMIEDEAALYEAPFAHVLEQVKYQRVSNRERSRAENWWRLGRTRPELREKLRSISRYIATVETAKHRFFVWLPVAVAAEHKLVVIPRDDDECFGILSSRFHVSWALAAGGRLGVGNDPVYTTSKCFDPFPFPEGLIPSSPYSNPLHGVVSAAARHLNELRENWLNPPEWVERVPEVAAGFPDRVIAKAGYETDLRKRTLTKLYNVRPAWLDSAHKALDAAVAAAYGWTDYAPSMPDEEILRRLLALNGERAA